MDSLPISSTSADSISTNATSKLGALTQPIKKSALSEKQHDTSDIVIIGAGIIGLLTAKQLSEAGLQVTILDRQAAGQESSFAGGGILSALQPWRKPAALLNLIRWSLDAYPALVRQLHTETGINPDFIRSGIAFIDTPLSTSEQALLKKLFSTYQRRNNDNGLLGLENVAIRSHVDLIDETAQIRNPKLLAALKKFISMQGNVNLIEQAEVSKIAFKKNKILHIEANGRQYLANQYLITAGAWTNQLLEKIGLTSDIRPIKGQMLRVQPKKTLFQKILIKEGCYLIPRQNGKILIGSTVEDCGFDKTLLQESKDALLQKAYDMVPLLKGAQLIDHWAGLRPGTERNRPIIDRLPNCSNGYISTGHFRYGLACAPATANIMTNFILQSEGPINPAPYQWSAHQ